MIQVDTLDNFAKKNKHLFKKKIDFIKIDTEGNDLKVLIGSTEIIKKNIGQNLFKLK